MGIPQRFWKGNRYLPRVSYSLDKGQPEILSLFISIWGYLWGVYNRYRRERWKSPA